MTDNRTGPVPSGRQAAPSDLPGEAWDRFAEGKVSKPAFEFPLGKAVWLLLLVVCVAWFGVFSTREITIVAPGAYASEFEPPGARFSCGTASDSTPRSFQSMRFTGESPNDASDAVTSECNERRLLLGGVALAPGLVVLAAVLICRHRRAPETAS